MYSPALLPKVRAPKILNENGGFEIGKQIGKQSKLSIMNRSKNISLRFPLASPLYHKSRLYCCLFNKWMIIRVGKISLAICNNKEIFVK